MAELTTFLQRVLHAVGLIRPMISIDAHGEPAAEDVEKLAFLLAEEEDDVRRALIGLHGTDILVEQRLEFPGAEPAVWWTVHPQFAD